MDVTAHRMGVLLVATAALGSTRPAPAQTPPPAPYSLPWLLRSAVPANVVRVDESLASFEDPPSRTSGTTAVTSLVVSYKLGPRLALVGRQTWTRNSAPSGARSPSGSGFSNPLLGASFAHPLPSGWRWTAFLASTAPVGGGGSPDPGGAGAQSAAVPARSAMDNALFAVNYWTVIGGLGLARTTPRLTAQAEVTVLQLTRVRGPASQDPRRTNFTAGLHFGHFLSRRISVGAELRAQRWMSDAAPVRADPRGREQLTAAVGSRLHLKVGRTCWARPGLSYGRALDEPMAGRGYDLVQLDVPVSF